MCECRGGEFSFTLHACFCIPVLFFVFLHLHVKEVGGAQETPVLCVAQERCVCTCYCVCALENRMNGSMSNVGLRLL